MTEFMMHVAAIAVGVLIGHLLFIWMRKTVEFKNPVFVYKEYNDEDAYGEEIIQVFASESEAQDYLKQRVKSVTGATIEDLEEQASPDDIVSAEYVSYTDSTSTRFWIIEKHDVIR